MLNPNNQETRGWKLFSLKERFQFETLLFNLSCAFVNIAPSEVDKKIVQGLKEIVGFLGIGRCSLQEFLDDPKRLYATHSYQIDNIEPFSDIIVDEQLPWFTSALRRGKHIAMSRLPDDLPEEAIHEKEYCQRSGMKSFLAIPLVVSGAPIGVISFGSFRCIQDWPDELINRLKVLGEIFTNAIIRRRYQLELEEKHQFEQLISNLSFMFLNIPPTKIDVALNKGLRQIVEYLKVDRGVFYEFGEDDKEFLISHYWSVKEVKPFPKKVSAQRFPWLLSIICRNQIVEFSQVSEIPEEAIKDREYFLSQEAQSHISIPISYGESVNGAISFTAIRNSRTWPPKLVKCLTIIAEIFSNAIIRKRNHEAIGKLNNFERLLSELSIKFVNLPDSKVNNTIDDTLHQILEILNLDRVSLVELSEDKKKVKITHSASLPGIPTIPSEFVSEQLPWYSEKIRRGENIKFERLPDDLPEEATDEKEYVLRYGIKSIHDFPLTIGGETLGALSFGNTNSFRRWSNEEVRQLKLVSELFTNVIERKLREQKMEKAFCEIEELKARLEEEVIYLRKEVELKHEHCEVSGNSAAIKNVLSQIDQVAGTDTTVLLLGETGTGKELLAQEIHNFSKRKDRPMIKVNCAALPASLVEGELFGREKGAFTGAISRQIGRFESADGSTLFLDEIGELSMELQVKLLRVLQEGQFERLGSSKTINVDVRLITATNRDLEKAIKDGTFRKDLYYRFNVFPIPIPPLRERVEDIPELIWVFVKEFEKSMGKQIDSISKRSMEAMRRYAWPGNVRELRNVIEYAMITVQSKILEVKLPCTASNDIHHNLSLKEVERKHIRNVLNNTGWRIKGKNGAAEILGLKPPTLRSRLKRLGIQRPKK